MRSSYAMPMSSAILFVGKCHVSFTVLAPIFPGLAFLQSRSFLCLDSEGNIGEARLIVYRMPVSPSFISKPPGKLALTVYIVRELCSGVLSLLRMVNVYGPFKSPVFQTLVPAACCWMLPVAVSSRLILRFYFLCPVGIRTSLLSTIFLHVCVCEQCGHLVGQDTCLLVLYMCVIMTCDCLLLSLLCF